MAVSYPTTDLGYAPGGPLLLGALMDLADEIPELRWPLSIRVYDRMRRDPQLKAILNAVTLPLRRATWVVEPAGATARMTRQVADDLGLAVAGDKTTNAGAQATRGVSWAKHLRLALLDVAFGHSPFELTVNVKDGQVRLADLGERLPQSIAEILVADDGSLRGIKQYGRGVSTQDEPLISADRLVWYSHEQEGGAWQGQSMLRPAYGAWLMKHEIWRVHATGVRRNSMGFWQVNTPPGATPAQVSEAQRLASSVRAGDTAGVGLPAGWTAELRGMVGSVPDPMPFIKYLDQQMSRMVLAQFLELGETSHGSRALGESFIDFFTLSLEALADEVAATATEQIAARLTVWNQGDAAASPVIRCTGIGQQHDITAQTVLQLTQSGVLTADDGVEDYLREVYGLPARDPATARKPAPVPPPPEPKQPPVAASRAVAAAADSPTVGHRVATAAEQTAGVDFQRMQDDFDAHLAALLAAWKLTVRAPQIDTLVEQVHAAVAAGDTAALGALSAPAVGQALLEEQMRALATQAITAAVSEATAQGATVTAPDVESVVQAVTGRATAVDQVMAATIAAAAARSALTQAGPGANPETAAAAVRADLEGLSDTFLTDQLGGALTAAQNEARFQVAETAPVSNVYASELLDTATCELCAAEDGKQFGSLAAARAAYPTGGYRDCLGGPRCRGTVVVVYAMESPATIDEAAA